MYGLVNRAIEEMVVAFHGDSVWRQIMDVAGVDVEMFVRLEQYPDDVTYRLVAAASEVLAAPAPDLLRAFGRYWVQYTGSSAYGSLLKPPGVSLIGALAGLDAMHRRVGETMPHLRPPSFAVTDATPVSARIHYRSEREGLAPMVVGLLEGYAELFGVRVVITHVEDRAAGADHDVFGLVIEDH